MSENNFLECRCPAAYAVDTYRLTTRRLRKLYTLYNAVAKIILVDLNPEISDNLSNYLSTKTRITNIVQILQLQLICQQPTLDKYKYRKIQKVAIYWRITCLCASPSQSTASVLKITCFLKHPIVKQEF